MKEITVRAFDSPPISEEIHRKPTHDLQLTSYGFSIMLYSLNTTANSSTPISYPSSTAGYQLWSSENLATRAMFGYESNSSARDVTDGLSNTVAVAETTFDVHNGKGQPWSCIDWVGGGSVEFAPTAAINVWDTAAYIAASYSPAPGTLASWMYPGSKHVGGMQVLMGDGAVRFLSQSLSATTIQQLGYIADGQAPRDF